MTEHLSSKGRFGYYYGLFTVIGEVNTYGRGACRSYLFEPVPPEDLASIIAEHNMYISLEKILDGKTNLLNVNDVEDVIIDHLKRIEGAINGTNTVSVH